MDALPPGPTPQTRRPFVAFWPITDPDADLDTLVGEAWPTLDDVAARAGARLAAGPRRWSIRQGKDVAGAGAYPTVLVLHTVAEEAPTPRARRLLAEHAAAVEARTTHNRRGGASRAR